MKFNQNTHSIAFPKRSITFIIINTLLQLWYPYYRLREEGHETFTIGPEKGKTYNSKHGYPCKAEQGIDDIKHEVSKQSNNEVLNKIL